jgi:hypothetical protein
MAEAVNTEAPIFIVGTGRSGTSLLRNILNRHPRIAISDETHFLQYVYSRRRAFGNLDNPAHRRRVADEYVRLKHLRVISDPGALRARLLRDATSYRGLFTSLAANYAELQGKPRWGEKTPHHALFAGTLCEWYPHATIIHIVRDPRDVVASLQRMPWSAGSVVRNAMTWRRINLAARQCCDRPQYMSIRYETLVREPERTVAGICERLGEEYFPSMLVATKPTLLHPSPPWLARAAEAITAERLEKWRAELTAEEASQIEWAVGEHLESFGYRRAAEPASIQAIVRGLGRAAWDAAHQRFRQLPASWCRLVRPTKLAKEEYWTYKGRTRGFRA